MAERIASPRVALEGERKQVTVLFADLQSSMELLDSRDPEQAGAILETVIELMTGAVHLYEGTVNQVMGDGIMALFGAPLAFEDHAVRACYAALSMTAALRRRAGQVAGVHLQLRVGLNSGEAVVRTIGSDLHVEYTALTSMFLTDARGSLVATTDSAGGVQSELTYEPFGNTEMSSPAPAYRFTGREHDEPLYLYYYRARYYHTDLQRFISEDPVGFMGDQMPH